MFSGGQPEPRASPDLRGLLDLLSDHICLDQRPVPPESVQWPLMEARQDSSFHQRKSALRYDKSEPADSTRWLQRRPWEAEAMNRGGRTEGSSAHRTTVRQGPGTGNSRCHQAWQGGPSIPNIVLFHLPIDRCPLSLVSTWRGGKKEWVERLGAQKYT